MSAEAAYRRLLAHSLRCPHCGPGRSCAQAYRLLGIWQAQRRQTAR